MSAVVAGLLTLLLILTDTGGDGIIGGMILACMPVPLYTGVALWLDRYEPEPPLYLLGAFIWGATIAVFVSYIFNTINGILLGALLGQGGSALAAVLSAPFVEESSKALGLFILFLWKREEFDGIVDGVVYATMIALGFAMVENISYYGRAFHGGGAETAGVLFVIRGVLSPYSHPLFTAMTGVGLGWSRQTDKLPIKILAPFGGLGLAMTLHMLWNLTASIHAGLWLAAYLLIMIPTAITLLVVVGFALHREAGLIRRYLQPEVEEGKLTLQELATLVSVPGRIAYSFKALFRGGPRAWWAAEHFLHGTTELAFIRDRVQRGLTSAESGAEQELKLSDLFADRKVEAGFTPPEETAPAAEPESEPQETAPYAALPPTLKINLAELDKDE